MKEILSSIKDSARERIKNPLFGAFIFYWCVYNWEVILRVYSIDNDPDVVIDALKPLLEDLGRYLWPLLYSVISVGFLPWTTVVIQKLRSKPLMVSKEDKFDFELKLLKAKEKIITQEAHNEGLKSKISKEMDLSLKEQEFNLDQKIRQSDLKAKIEEVEKEKRENLQKREELDNDNQTLMEKRKKNEEDESKNVKERAELDKVNQSLKDQHKKLQEDQLEHVKQTQSLIKKKEKLKENKPSRGALGLGAALLGTENDPKNKRGATLKALLSEKE